MARRPPCLTLVVSCIFRIPSTMSETLLLSSCTARTFVIVALEEGHGYGIIIHVLLRL